MLELIQITNDPAFARRCDALGGFRLFVDLERLGKAERQAGRNTFISAHRIEDVGRVKQVLRRSPLMVRVNPLNHATRRRGRGGAGARRRPADAADVHRAPRELREFAALVAGRVPIVAAAGNRRGAGQPGRLDRDARAWPRCTWASTTCTCRLGHRFMFEPLALGLVDRVAQAARRQGLRFGFGGIARLDEGLLPGPRRAGRAPAAGLGFGHPVAHLPSRRGRATAFEAEVAKLRQAEEELAAAHARRKSTRTPARIAAVIGRIAAGAGRAA